MTQLFECVPNVSEGRDLALLTRFRQPIELAGATLLDQSADPDHNRSVFTLVGEAAQLEEAVLAAAALAVEHIDLREHRGVHPFLGALDVVPFVPLLGATKADAVRLAESVAERVARELRLPAYLYEWAARRPDRRNLADVRRGGFGSLKQRLAAPGGAPDFGPREPHRSAGATVVGARDFLVAFNVVLEASDVSVAKRVARRVRQSSGGLPGLKALGVPLPSRGLSQVSMNLVDFRQTNVPAAVEAVRREARRLGSEVQETELIGLTPRAALAGADPIRDLQLVDFSADRILEVALERRH